MTSTKVVELRTQFIAKLKELKALQEKEARSEDDEKQVDLLLAEVNDLGPKMEREIALDLQTQAITTHEQVQARGTQQSAEARNTPVDPTTGKPFDRRSIGRIVSGSESFNDYRKNPRGKSAPIDLGSLYPEHRMRAMVEHHEDLSPEELRALIHVGALPTDMVRPQILTQIYRGTEPIAGVRDVLVNGTTTSDAIIFMRELLYTNAAVEVAEAVSLVTGAKPESSLTFEQATSPVETIAHWIPITRQTLDDASQLRSYVEGRLLDGLTRRVNGQLLNGNGTPPNLRGILQTAGIQSLTTAGEFTTSPVVDAGTSNENFNRIRRGKRHVRVTGDANPNFVVLNPVDLEQFETYSDANRQYIAGDPMSGAPVTRMWGMRVVEDEHIAVNTALVGDGSMAAVWDRMQAQIFVADQHADFFIRNIFVLLAETRLALTVFRPAAFASVELVA